MPSRAEPSSLRPRRELPCLAFVLAACSSCSEPSATDAVPVAKHVVRSTPKPSPPWYDPAATRHDFGLVLAGSDVTRKHTFRIANASDRPVRIRRVANRKPCCGDVAPIAATVVEPGRSIEVAVTIHIGLAAGRVIHVAEVEADGDPNVEIRTTATAHARVTIEEVGSTTGPLEPGQSRRVEYLVRAFGLAGDPPPPLDDRAIRSELPVEWVGLSSTGRDTESGLDEFRRTLAVALPASNEPTHRTTSLEILDAAGSVVGRRWTNWEVAPALKASPAGLVFTNDGPAADGLRVAVRRGDGRPFRIASVTTELEDLSVRVDGEDARPLHLLTARLGVPGRPGPRSGEIVIRTDHPGQPVLKVAVYVAGRAPVAPTREAKEASP